MIRLKVSHACLCLFVGLTLSSLVPQETSADLSIADLINYGNDQQFSRAARRSASASGGQQNEPIRCGYDSCPRTSNEKINVHVIAHSHDDVGWLKTVDQYYYGTNKRRSIVGVRHILNSVVPQLVMDPKKRFIYVEMSFFYKWWEEQEEPMRDIVRRLVNEGRLEFINGGWCMNDEATVNYQSTIEQMTLGLRFLNETFGQCGQPRTGWQIDPFGHTSEQASLFAQFGFDSMFVARISFEDKMLRRANKSLDIVWHADQALANQAGSIYTNVMWEGYDAPYGFCFDAQCFDDEIVDNKKSYEYNIEKRARDLIELYRQRAEFKLTNDLLMPFGGDFQFTAAEQNFNNIDKLIKYINDNAPDIHMFYSTPSCYAYSVNQHSKKKQLELPEKYDDFMPYDSTPTVWWSGYFTSRPSVKLIERQVADLLQLARIVSLNSLIERSRKPNFSWLREVKSHEDQCLLPLWEILGDLQHHDAVTGTEKQHVADDYVRRAQDAINLCSKFIGTPRRQLLESKMRQSALYKKLASVKSKYSNLETIFLDKTNLCQSLNISQCEPLESNVDHNTYKLQRSDDGQNHHQAAASAAASDHSDFGVVHSTDNQTNKSKKEFPTELETRGVLMHAYNPYSHQIKQQDFRLPCLGMCDLTKVRVTQLANNASLQLIRLPVPSGVLEQAFRDSLTTFEVLFYADLPPLGYTSFIIEDLNTDELIDEELDIYDTSSTSGANGNSEPIELRKELKPVVANTALRQKRIKRQVESSSRFDYFEIGTNSKTRSRRGLGGGAQSAEASESEKIVVKFDMQAGMIVGLKRVSDGSTLNISQKFGYYYPANSSPFPGAYIFRPNTTEPHLMEKPLYYKMYKRKNGALVEIHQKWRNWIWQTIRVDSKKNYIEFDYVVGPVPVNMESFNSTGREVVTRYITDMKTDGVFLTDSNARQLLVRKSRMGPQMMAENLGGNFYPVVSTIMLKNTKDQGNCTKCKAEAVSVLVDRPQAGTSSHEGQLELLIHRRLLRDDNFGVGEALNEPGEDGRGLVTRGKHRLFLRFPKNNVATGGAITSKSNPKPVMFKMPTEELGQNSNRANTNPFYIVHDQLLNDLNQESRKYALRPVLTFDRLRVTTNQFIEMLSAQQTDIGSLGELSLLNSSLPNNIHLLTIQPWSSGAPNQLLIRLENLDNPLLIHNSRNHNSYTAVFQSYVNSSDYREENRAGSGCDSELRPRTSVDIENMIRGIRITMFEELSLGANTKLQDVKRLNFTGQSYEVDECERSEVPTVVSLAPRQIRTLLANFETL